jgi:hypothetical protein
MFKTLMDLALETKDFEWAKKIRLIDMEFGIDNITIGYIGSEEDNFALNLLLQAENILRRIK